MAFDWTSYLRIAGELASRTGDEAAERSAISRTYYAAFGMARAHLRDAGVALPRSGRAHLLVWDHFNMGPDSRHRRIANLGRRLLSWRRRADYDDIYLDLSRDARRSVEMARQLLTDLEQLR